MHSTIQWCKYLTIASILHIELLSIEVILRHSAIKGRQRNHLTEHQSNTGFNELSLLAMCLRIPLPGAI